MGKKSMGISSFKFMQLNDILSSPLPNLFLAAKYIRQLKGHPLLVS